jgi:hypothetical protein
MNIDDFTTIMFIINHFIIHKNLQTFVIPAQERSSFGERDTPIEKFPLARE